MSGSGRKTNYRKGVTKKVLYDDPEPKENEQIVQVVGLRGSNLFEVKNEHGEASVTMLPTKYRKLIWVKRGDFLIVGSGEAEASAAKGKKKAAVTSIVEHILYKDQIKNLKAKNLWPEAFEKPAADEDKASDENDETNAHDAVAADGDEQDAAADAAKKQGAAKSSNGIMMLDTSFADMHLNRNRRKGVFDEEEEDEDSD
uniref:S1-like domain-containing protein n=1 Tax=Globisporangium ultimum (strain ATCC 200006 / CBS 805.95 / DAOM BR144) TaxID=431595 RepID=K3WB96_GLOUD